MIKILIKIDRALTELESTIVATGVFTTTFLIFINVVARYVFNNSLMWVEELVRYMMIWVTFLGADLCIKSNIHVKMDLLHIKLPEKAAKVLFCLTCLVCIFGCFYLTKYGYVLAGRVIKTNQVSTAMPWLKVWYVDLAIPVFGVLAMKDYLILLILNLIRKGEIVKTIGGEN